MMQRLATPGRGAGRSLIVAASLALLGTACLAEPAQDASHFTWQAGREAGAATLQPPYGGEYVYSVVERLDGRIEQRFPIGKPLRTEFELFSADEEAALWQLREQLLHPVHLPYPSQRPRRARSAAVVAGRPSIDWPKVIVRDGRTCVPQSSFADAPDWASHLICWLGVRREVTHE